MTGREAIEALEKGIWVSIFYFEIEHWSAREAIGERRWGECSCSAQKINLCIDMPSSLKAADTLLHEVGHALYYAYGISDDDAEERVVNIMATGWVLIFKDNPWLLEWLKNACRA